VEELAEVEVVELDLPPDEDPVEVVAVTPVEVVAVTPVEVVAVTPVAQAKPSGLDLANEPQPDAGSFEIMQESPDPDAAAEPKQDEDDDGWRDYEDDDDPHDDVAPGASGPPPQLLVAAGAMGLVVLLMLGWALFGGSEEPPPRREPTKTASKGPDAKPEVKSKPKAKPEAEPKAEAKPKADPKPKPKPKTRRPAEIRASIARLTAAEDFEGALREFAELREAVDVKTAAIDLAETALREQQALHAEAVATQAKLSELRASDPEEARRHADAFVRKYPEVPNTKTFVALIELIEAIQREVPIVTGGVAPTEVREEPPERKARLAELAAAGAERVAELRERIDRERGEREGLEQAELERAREASLEEPQKVRLPSGYTIEGAAVEAYDNRSVTLVGDGDKVSVGWGDLDTSLATRLRRYGVRRDDAQDNLRLGLWYLRRRMFTRARSTFGRVAKLDPSLADRLPDVDALAEAGQVFSGELERDGNKVSVEYTFDDPAELDDWSNYVSRAKVGLEKGRMYMQGNGLFLMRLKDVGFDGEVEIGAELGETSGDAGIVFGIAFNLDTPEEHLYLVGAFPNAKQVALFHQYKGEFEEVARKRGSIRGTLRLRVKKDTVEVLGSKRIGHTLAADATWDNVAVLAGGITRGRAQQVSFKNMTFKGRVRRAWLRKSFRHLEALLRTTLARFDELPVFAAGDPPPEAPLSAEDDFGMQGVSAVAKQHYARAMQSLEQADETTDEGWKQLVKATEDLSKAIDAAPEFAAAYYRRAYVLLRVGSVRLALPDVEQALRCCPSFYEAHALHSALLSSANRPEEALAAAEAALELAPACADAHAAMGLVHQNAERLSEALASFEIALALAPWDPSLRQHVSNMHHLLRGPGWERTNRLETDHYLAESNLPPRTLERYVENLEAARAYFLTQFDFELPEVPRKAKLLLFDTREGYYAYADLTMDDRHESTLGLYLPRYRQLLLFEDKRDAFGEATRGTLYHEGFHQFLHQYVGDALVPFWLNEGLAEYFSAIEVEDGKVVKDGLLQAQRVPDVHYLLEANRGRPLPFDRMMQESPNEFYSGPVSLKYAQAWSMVHYFYREAPEPIRKRFSTYVSLILGGASGDDAFKEAWAGVNWRQVENGWIEFAKTLK